MRRAWITLGALAAILTCTVRLAQAQEGPALGGHIGFVLPLVTDTSGNTSSLADAPAVGFPMGITITGGGRMAFDLEFVPQYNATRQRLTTLTVHPGILWGFEKTWAVGLRAAFDVNQPSTGFTPLLHRTLPIRNHHWLKDYFAEADLPVRFNRPVGQPATNAVTFAMHFGVAF